MNYFCLFSVKSLGGAWSPLHGTQAIFIKHSGGMGTVTLPSVSISSSSSSPAVTAYVTASQSSQVTTSSAMSAALLLGKSGLGLATPQGGSSLGLVTTSTSNSPATSVLTTTSKPHATLVTNVAGKPMMAKMLANSQGQIISMETLIAHQKQQLAAAAAAGTGMKYLFTYRKSG